MLNLTEDNLSVIRDQLADASPTAVGYRIIIQPVLARKTMEGVESKEFETLSKYGFEVKTEDQEAKESHGSDVGVVVHVGQDAYNFGNLKDCDNWCKEGDVVIYGRYAGQRVELPPASGNFYHIMNDDDIRGKYEGVSYE